MKAIYKFDKASKERVIPDIEEQKLETDTEPILHRYT
jgi:hypothetical protein